MLICCDRDVSPDDMIGTVYVRNSCNRLQTKLFIYSRCRTLTIRSTVVSVADVDRRLICLSDPARCHGPPRCIYVGYGRYLFVDIMPRAPADLGVTSRPQDLHGLKTG